MSFYWYEKNPNLLNAEKAQMAKYLPTFKLAKLEDGRLYWEGTVNPSGKFGDVWRLMVIYDHNHPHNNSWGGSLKVYSIQPDLKEISKKIGRIPHVLVDSWDNYYICPARPKDLGDGKSKISTAMQVIGFAITWIYVFERWRNGEIGNEIFSETY